MFSFPIYASWPLNFKSFKSVYTEKMDVNERVPLMNGIVTYSWAIIGIAIQAQRFLMYKSYLLSTLFKKTVISAPVLLSQTSEND